MRLRAATKRRLVGVSRVLITGAGGFLGSHLTERLLAEGYEVVGFDNFSSGHSRFLGEAANNERFEFVKGDVLDASSLRRAMTGCDYVFHFAGNTDHSLDIKQPSVDLTQNTIGTLNLMQCMVAARINRIAFASSGEVYGESPLLPTPEEAPFPHVATLHGTSKLACEGILRSYAREYALDVHIFRLGSILGPRASRNLVATIYRDLLRDATKLELPNAGSQRASYLHVDDCLNAMFHVIGRKTSDSRPTFAEVFNLGAPEICRVTDLVRYVSRHLGLLPTMSLDHQPSRPRHVESLAFLDTRRVQSTGWTARISIQDSVISTLDWLRNHHWALGPEFAKLLPPERMVAEFTPPQAEPCANTRKQNKRSLLKELVSGDE